MSESAPPDPSRRWRLVCTLVLGAYAVLTTFVWLDPEFRPQWDAACYVLTAKSLAAGQGYTYAGQPFFLRPPGTSFLVSLFLDADGGFDPARINRLVMVSAATSVAAVFLCLSLHHHAWLALAAAVLYGTCPVVVSWFNYVLSEFPYLTLVFLGMFLLEAAARRGALWWTGSLLAALVLAAAFYFRSLAALLLPAIPFLGGSRVRGPRRWRGIAPAALFLALVMPWMVYAREAAAVAERPSEQLLLFDYGTAIFRVNPSDPDSALVPLAAWIERVSGNARTISAALAEQMIGPQDARLGLVLLIVIAVGAARVVRRGAGLLEWYALGYLGVMLAYFTFERRLIVPWMPVAYRYLLAAFVPGRQGSRAAGMLGAATVAVLLGLNFTRLPQTLDPFHENGVISRRGAVKTDTATLSAWVRGSTQEDAVILCNQAPNLELLSGRRCYTWRYPSSPWLLQKYQPDYVVLEGPLPPGFEEYVRRNAELMTVLPDALESGGMRVYRVNKPIPPAPR